MDSVWGRHLPFLLHCAAYTATVFPRGHGALLNFHSICTLAPCYPGRKSMPFPMKRTHGADESIRSYLNKSLKPLNFLWNRIAFFSQLQLFCVIRSMILEWHIEYFIDCLHALQWPAWHANFVSQKRLCVTLYQAVRHDAPRTFPVNKLLLSRGNTEQRWAVHTHTHTNTVHTSPPSLTVPPSPLEQPYKNHGRAQWVEASLNLILSHGATLLMEHSVQVTAHLPLPKYSHPPLRWDRHFLVDLIGHILRLK